MTNPADSWLSIAEAATALGVSENAIRVRVRRGKLLASRGNDGHIRVSVDQRRPTLSTIVESTNASPAEPMVPLSALLEQAAQHRADLDDQQARHDADVARRLAERDTLHLGHIERLLAQAAIERSLLVERVDAAEIRAERVEQRLDQVLDMLLTERRSVLTRDETGEREPWWRRWFGESRRSKLGGG